jgi:preprotein translocase subunit SecB
MSTPASISNDQRSDGNQAAPQFSIQKIYVKDVSFEAPGAPQIFTQQIGPQANLQLSNSAATIAPGVHEVVLSLTVTAKQDDKTIFLVELQQAGIFAIQGYSDQDVAAMLGSYCPNILFPFAREAIADLITRGGFPTLLLAPINFDALYAQRLQGQQAQGSTN